MNGTMIPNVISGARISILLRENRTRWGSGCWWVIALSSFPLDGCLWESVGEPGASGCERDGLGQGHRRPTPCRVTEVDARDRVVAGAQLLTWRDYSSWPNFSPTPRPAPLPQHPRNCGAHAVDVICKGPFGKEAGTAAGVLFCVLSFRC